MGYVAKLTKLIKERDSLVESLWRKKLAVPAVLVNRLLDVYADQTEVILGFCFQIVCILVQVFIESI